MNNVILTVSIVVHNQAEIAQELLGDISDLGDKLSAEIIFTVNTDEPLPFAVSAYHHSVKVIRNKKPKGFGANHNFAFKHSRGRYFCVLNPDIRLVGNPFDALIACLNDTKAGVVAPRIINPNGRIENSARRFPTPFSILSKAINKTSEVDYPHTNKYCLPDWIGGMFMLFPSDCFRRMEGFDERYFLYYEDVDLCARMKMVHRNVVLCPQATAIHDARCDSHHDMQYMRWHLSSMLRFFTSKGFLKLVVAPNLRP